MPIEKSTNVRTYANRRSVPLVRAGLGTLGAVAPGLAGRWATRLFLTPPRYPTPLREASILASGEPFVVHAGRARLSARRWGDGPIVVLLHGWGGRGTQLFAFVEPLVRSGFRVVLFDAPAHGGSSGHTSSLPAFARALAAVVEEIGPIHGVVAHSMGAAACMLAASEGVEVPRAVLIAPPSNAHAFFERFARYLDLPADVERDAEARIERKLRTPWARLNAEALGRATVREVPLLVFHDAEDREVTLSQGEAIVQSWPNAELVVTSGLGHQRILRDPRVVTETVRFFARATPPLRPGQREQEELERELFERSRRWPRSAA
jgi:pimeloyl-ACP methyl ester carboxylesterase